jgi:oligopeptide transport system substrate-binding protein
MQTAYGIPLLSRCGAALLCLILILALPGCGNNPYPDGETASATLYLSLRDDPVTLDPTCSYTPAIVDNICPAYFQYRYLKRDGDRLELALGAELPRREPLRLNAADPLPRQGEVWTFRIKHGLRFQDDPCFPGGKGREITAADFLYSFRRIADPDVDSPWLTFFEDKVLGFHDYVLQNRQRIAKGQTADYAVPVPGLQPVPGDPYAFRILLNQSFPQLRYLMSMRLTTPQASEATARYGKEIARHPVGCGPYKVAEYKTKQRIVLVRNANYRPEFYPNDGNADDRAADLMADASKPLPRTDKIVYTVLRESVTSWNRFLQGYEDIWSVTQTNYQQVITGQGKLTPEMERMGIQLKRVLTPNINSFFFNMTDPVYGGYTPEHRKLRQAISLAIDSQALIDLYAQGNAEAAQFLIPPGVPGYESGYRNPYCGHDLARAKRLLAEAGYANGIDPHTGERLVLYFDNTALDAASRQYVALVSRQIETLGIHVVSRSWRSTTIRERMDKGQWQFVAHLWIADYPDPEDFLILLYGPNCRPGPNLAAYANAEFDRLFERLRGMNDGPERMALLRRIRAIVVEDCPIIYARHDQTLLIMHDWVHNNKPPNVDMDYKKYLSVDGRLRAQRQAEWNHPNYAPAVVLVVMLMAGVLPAVGLVRGKQERRQRRRPAGGRT